MYHLPNQQLAVFQVGEMIAQVLARGAPHTQLLTWFELKQNDQYVSQFLYHDIPVGKCWVQQSSNHQQTFPTVSRLYSASPSSGDRCFLRRILTVV
jgi:hypothetical protein